MKSIDEMNALELNEAILRALGYEKLPFPAIPQWQKPGGQLFNIPQYSTSIAAAWELVEDTMAEPYEQFIEIRKTPATSNFWYCEIGCITMRGDTAPLAISRAWLKWQENRNG